MTVRIQSILALLLIGCTPVEDDDPIDTPTEVQVFDACAGDGFSIIDPVDGFAWTPLAVTLVSEEVADNVFAIYDANAAAYEPQGIPLATSGGFVIGDDGVLLVDTMINRQLLCQVYDLVRAETDKPVLYAVNTSHHGDHSYGNAFLPDEVQVVQHERTAAFIASSFEEDVLFMETNFGADQGIDEVTPIVPDIPVGDAGWSVDLGGITVQAQFHGFAQTHGDLFVYVPEAQVMWTGNPVVAAQPAIPWLLDGHAHEVSATLGAVQNALPEGAVVIPGHGRPTVKGVFSFSVDYLDALIVGIEAEVQAGSELEVTQANVLMEEYQGYSLWDWVHTWVNVPSTFAELNE